MECNIDVKTNENIKEQEASTITVKNKKRKKRLIIFFLCTIALLIAATLFCSVFDDNISYAVADSKLEKGDVAAARQIFVNLGNFNDSRDRVLKIDYINACIVMDNEDYTRAIPMFETIICYADSKARIAQCYTLIADGYFEVGEYDRARRNYETACCASGIKKTDIAWGDKLFSSDDYEGAVKKWQPYADEKYVNERLLDADYELTLIAAERGDFNAVIKANMLSFDERAAAAADMLLIMPKSSTVPIAASETHIAYIDKGGIVHADGSNSHGQCDVSSWHGVVSLCASGLNTFGLRYDGTVIAVGSDAFSQCDVSSWTDIVSVVSTDNAVFGLTSEGSVVFAGGIEGWYEDVLEWSGIVKICAGMEHIVALDRAGNVYTTGKNEYGQCDVAEETDIKDIACGPMHTILIKNDCNVYIKGVDAAFKESLETKTDAVSSSSSWSHIVFQDSNGSLSAYGSNGRGQCDVLGWKDIIWYTAKANFTVGVKNDGSVLTTVQGHTLDWQVLVWQ